MFLFGTTALFLDSIGKKMSDEQIEEKKVYDTIYRKIYLQILHSSNLPISVVTKEAKKLTEKRVEEYFIAKENGQPIPLH
jgi:hypothetical protein